MKKNTEKKAEEKDTFDKELYVLKLKNTITELETNINKVVVNEDQKKKYLTIRAEMVGLGSCDLCGGKGHDFFSCGTKKKLDKIFKQLPEIKVYWSLDKMKRFLDIEISELQKYNS